MKTPTPGQSPTQPTINSAGMSYLLWLACFMGISGLHRFYNRKPVSGVIWLCTWGFLGIGQFIDLFLIPGMVEDHNLRSRARFGLLPYGMTNGQTIQVVIPPEAIASASAPAAPPTPPTKEELMLKLLRAAEGRGGRLSVTQAVLDTGLSFEVVEEVLKDMLRTGYVAVENHPTSGVVVYNFLEL